MHAHLSCFTILLKKLDRQVWMQDDLQYLFVHAIKLRFMIFCTQQHQVKCIPHKVHSFSTRNFSMQQSNKFLSSQTQTKGTISCKLNGFKNNSTCTKIALRSRNKKYHYFRKIWYKPYIKCNICIWNTHLKENIHTSLCIYQTNEFRSKSQNYTKHTVLSFKSCHL